LAGAETTACTMSNIHGQDDEDTDDLIMLLVLAAVALFLYEQEKQENGFTPTSRMINRLSFEARRRRHGKIRRVSLLHPSASAFEKLYQSQQDDALITLCGFDHASFQQLHALFHPIFSTRTPHGSSGMIEKLPLPSTRSIGGRPRKISSIQALALYLAWTRTRGKLSILSIIFGIIPSMVSVWVRFSRRVLIKVLKNHPLARVEVPNDQTIEEIVQAVRSKYPELEQHDQYVWAAMDGLKLYLERAGDDDIQNKFYNGWQHDHFVNSLLLFSADGKVRAAFFNAPGSLHDSTMSIWGDIYQVIDEIFLRLGVKVVVDSAFGKENRESLLKSYQTNLTDGGRLRQPDAVHRDACSIRQLAEWGMYGFQGSFPRLKDRLAYEERGERKLIMQSIILLYNFRASTVGQNQIQSSFMGPLAGNASQYAHCNNF